MTGSGPRRLFVGIELTDAARVCCRAVRETLRQSGFDAKYETGAKLHLTIAFLGYVEPRGYRAVADAFLNCAANVASFCVTLDTLAAFPNEQRPRVVYIGAREQSAAFLQLSSHVRGAYVKHGFDFKSDSLAHVTIARVKAASRPLPSIEFSAIGVHVARLTLFESLADKTNNTSRYERLETAPLATAVSEV